MKRNAVEVYALAVCFFTVACCVVALSIALYDVVQIAAPAFTASFPYDERFVRPVELGPAKVDSAAAPTEAELEAERRRQREVSIENEKRRAQQSLVQMGILIGIDIGLFAVHWHLARKARASAVA
jgi:hypothetical protein